MTHSSALMKHQNGFTLVEMAIVLLIVGLLLGGLLPTISGQVEQQRRNETRKQLDEIKEALIGFTIINGRLPCPADSAIVTGQTGAGTERTPPCTNGNSTGVLPWATLGVKETDGWGNRYTYRVSSDFADAIGSTTYGGCIPNPTPAISTFALCSNGNLDVRSAASGGTSIAINVPAVIISHGKNSAGAYTQQGTQLPVSSDADKRENSDGNANNNYISHTPTQNFDDLVVWLSPNTLFNRMVTAGKLP
jgi:prepilin-type N-terminal cleavage/methylation domain-containing protein